MTSFCIAYPKSGKEEGCDGCGEPAIKLPIFMEMKPSQTHFPTIPNKNIFEFVIIKQRWQTGWYS
jgi:hypothetical protein